jgi:outer membrane protein TolC
VEQSAFEAVQLLGRREQKLSAEAGAAKAELRELTARLKKAKAGLLEQAEGEGQVRDFRTPADRRLNGTLSKHSV